jgi:hypothetical protein
MEVQFKCKLYCGPDVDRSRSGGPSRHTWSRIDSNPVTELRIQPWQGCRHCMVLDSQSHRLNLRAGIVHNQTDFEVGRLALQSKNRNPILSVHIMFALNMK